MHLQDQPRIRKAILAGAAALALTGTGVAFAWAADSPFPSPSQSASPSAPGQENKQDKPDKAQRPQPLHSEGVVKKADGSFQTVLEQRGTVEAVSSTSITVKSEDGYSQTYAVNTETKITKVPAPAADGAPATGDDGKRLKPTDGTIADITTGEAVRISGGKNGGEVTAERIVEGAGDGPGLGLGQGKGLGKGHGLRNDHGQGRGHGQGHEKGQGDEK